MQSDTIPALTLPHHQELAASSPAFVNASVEFDTASLRPTYRLLWGAAGESNALAVAQGLGFSPSVVAAARQVRGSCCALTVLPACLPGNALCLVPRLLNHFSA